MRKIEPNQDIEVDLIRGKVVINSSVLDDKVLYKSADELPTYHLINVVDDHLMRITHDQEKSGCLRTAARVCTNTCLGKACPGSRLPLC